MHPTSTFDVILLDHADRLATARRQRESARRPRPERPPEPRPHWAWSDTLQPVPLVGAVAR